jgi:hypothetical protein
MTRTWERTNAEGDTLRVTVDAQGAAVSVQTVTGHREGWAVTHEAFEDEWMPWLAAAFDDVRDEIDAAVKLARAQADDVDDQIP